MSNLSPNKILVIALTILVSAVSLTSCRQKKKTIETFQFEHNSWGTRLHSEMERESFFFPRYDFMFHTASTVEEQISQIEEAIKRKTDAIIVNAYNPDVVPVLEKAYKEGVKVIIVGQKIPSLYYTAHVGCDNFRLGTIAAEHVVGRLPNGGNILLIDNYSPSPYYQDRKNGFMHVVDEYENVNIVANFDAGTNADLAHEKVDSVYNVLGSTRVDVVVSFGIEAIIGAEASQHYPDALYIGMEGVPDDGLEAVTSGKIDATFHNPTGGDVAIDLAARILSGQKHDTEIILEPYCVDQSNAKTVATMFESLMGNFNKVDNLIQQIHRSDKYLSQAFAMSVILGALFLLTLFLLLHTARQSRARSSRIIALEEAQTSLKKELQDCTNRAEVSEHIKKQLEEERRILIDITSDGARKSSSTPSAESDFNQAFHNAIINNLSDVELSVDTLASILKVSRANLFRRVKSATGHTPNEVIISMRMEKAKELIENTDLPITEIAYSVGFASSSYFAKCYRDRFGVTPRNSRE